MLAAEKVVEGRGHDIAVGMIMRFVVTAGKNFSCGSDDNAAPYAKTGFAEWPTMVATVGTLDIPAVPRVGRHEGMTVGVVVQLGGFESQFIGSEGFIDALECVPFVFIGFQS